MMRPATIRTIRAMVNVPKGDGSSNITLTRYADAAYSMKEHGVMFYFDGDKEEFISYRFLVSFQVYFVEPAPIKAPKKDRSNDHLTLAVDP